MRLISRKLGIGLLYFREKNTILYEILLKGVKCVVKRKKKLWRKELIKNKVYGGMTVLLGLISWVLTGNWAFAVLPLWIGLGLFFSRENYIDDNED